MELIALVDICKETRYIKKKKRTPMFLTTSNIYYSYSTGGWDLV